jgi:chitin disaccharide deacetylase
LKFLFHDGMLHKLASRLHRRDAAPDPAPFPFILRLPANMPRRLIVNADDLGLSPSVNTAIFDVFEAGNLTSATLMVAMPGTADAIARLPEHSGLAVGLHFCLTEGTALTGRSSLTDSEGRFRDRAGLIRAAYRGTVDAGDIRNELRAQLERMEAWNVKPTHVDSHEHVHMMPRIFDAMLPVLHELDIPVRSVDPPRSALLSLARPVKALKQWINKRSARRLKSVFRGRTNDSLVSIHDLAAQGPYDAGVYRRLIAATPADATVEVMVHPYILGGDVLAMYASSMVARRPFLERSAAEHEALRHGPVFEGETLMNFGDL